MASTTQQRGDSRTDGRSNGIPAAGIEQMARPEDLRAYEELAPGSASKILEVFWAHSEHRRRLERDRARTSQRRDYLNLFLVTLVAMAVFGASTWLVSTGHQLPGTIFGILAVVGAFLMFLMFLLRRVRV